MVWFSTKLLTTATRGMVIIVFPPANKLHGARNLALSPDGNWVVATQPTKEKNDRLVVLPTGAGPTSVVNVLHSRHQSGDQATILQDTGISTVLGFLPGGPYLIRHKMPVVYQALKPNGPIPSPTLGSP